MPFTTFHIFKMSWKSPSQSTHNNPYERFKPQYFFFFFFALNQILMVIFFHLIFFILFFLPRSLLWSVIKKALIVLLFYFFIFTHPDQGKDSGKYVWKITQNIYFFCYRCPNIWSNFTKLEPVSLGNQSSQLLRGVMWYLNAGGWEHSPAHNKTQSSDVCCSYAANSTLMHSSLSCALSIKLGCQSEAERTEGWGKEGKDGVILRAAGEHQSADQIVCTEAVVMFEWNLPLPHYHHI